MIKNNMKAILGEFVGSAFISFWGLGFIVPFAILGNVFDEWLASTGDNPARDLGPRICGFIYGLIKDYDVSAIFSNGQWIMYIIAAMIGGILGGLFHYKIVVKLLPKNK